MIKIKFMCIKKGYRLYPTHLFWFLGSKLSKKCDLYIETENQVYAIKLFGTPRRVSELHIKENGEYFIRSFLGLFGFGGACAFSIDSKIRIMPIYDFRYKYREEWNIKTPKNVLLVNPVPMEIRRHPNYGREVIVGAGETINGMEIYSLSLILGALESAL